MKYHNAIIENVYDSNPIAFKDVLEKCNRWADRLKEYIGSVEHIVFDAISEKCMNEYFSFVPEWNDVAVTQFLYGCLEDISSKGYSVEVASSYCGCTLALLKANYTFDDIDMQKIHLYAIFC